MGNKNLKLQFNDGGAPAQQDVMMHHGWNLTVQLNDTNHAVSFEIDQSAENCVDYMDSNGNMKFGQRSVNPTGANVNFYISTIKCTEGPYPIHWHGTNNSTHAESSGVINVKPDPKDNKLIILQ